MVNNVALLWLTKDDSRRLSSSVKNLKMSGNVLETRSSTRFVGKLPHLSISLRPRIFHNLLDLLSLFDRDTVNPSSSDTISLQERSLRCHINSSEFLKKRETEICLRCHTFARTSFKSLDSSFWNGKLWKLSSSNLIKLELGFTKLVEDTISIK